MKRSTKEMILRTAVPINYFGVDKENRKKHPFLSLAAGPVGVYSAEDQLENVVKGAIVPVVISRTALKSLIRLTKKQNPIPNLPEDLAKSIVTGLRFYLLGKGVTNLTSLKNYISKNLGKNINGQIF